MASKQDVENLRIKVQNLRKEVESVKVSMATKDDIKDMATKQDIKRLETIITGLGASYGIMYEDTFRIRS